LDAFYFNFVVLALGIFVVGAVSVYYFVHKKQMARKKTTKLIQAFIMEKAKKRGDMNKELGKLDTLLENRSIDKETYRRLKNILIVMDDKKGMRAEDLLDYVTDKK
jgi:hypothetical protein